MSVAVSLERLVAVPNSFPLWPEEFAALVAKLGDDPNDKAQWGVVADWCDENDETALGDAFRYVSNRPDIRARNVNTTVKGVKLWQFDDLPPSVNVIPYPNGDRGTIAGLASALAKMLQAAREAVKT